MFLILMFICVCWMFRDEHPVCRQMRPIEVARIIQIIHDGVRQRKISQTFCVSQRVVSRAWKHHEETGQYEKRSGSARTWSTTPQQDQ